MSEATEATALAKPGLPGATDFLMVLDKVASTPGMGVDVIERLLAVQERLLEDQRKVVCMDAVSRVQADIQHIFKSKAGQNAATRYAPLEDIDVHLRPLLAREGLTITLTEESHDAAARTTTFALIVAKGGYSYPVRRTFADDIAARNREGKAIRPAIQDDGSTTSYARRYLIKMAFNIIEKNEDTDGNSVATIGPEQIRDIEVQLQDLKMNRERFLRLLAVDNIEQILVRDLPKVTNAFAIKRESLQ